MPASWLGNDANDTESDKQGFEIRPVAAGLGRGLSGLRRPPRSCLPGEVGSIPLLGFPPCGHSFSFSSHQHPGKREICSILPASAEKQFSSSPPNAPASIDLAPSHPLTSSRVRAQLRQPSLRLPRFPIPDDRNHASRRRRHTHHHPAWISRRWWVDHLHATASTAIRGTYTPIYGAVESQPSDIAAFVRAAKTQSRFLHILVRH